MVLWRDGRAVVGIDLERVSPSCPRLPVDYFADAEQRFVRETHGPLCDPAVMSVWCAKEAVLKVLGVGLSVTTRSLECLPNEVGAADRDVRSFRILAR